MSDETEQDLERTRKNAAGTAKKGVKAGAKIGKTAWKVGKFIAKKFLKKKIVIYGGGSFLVFIFLLAPFFYLFSFLSLGDANGDNKVDPSDDELTEIYQKATNKANPKLKDSNGQDAQYLLKWRMVYTIDMLSHETRTEPVTKNKGNYQSMMKSRVNQESGLPYNDIDRLARELAPKFTYKKAENTVITKKKVKVKVKDPKSHQKHTKTKIEKHIKKQGVTLLVKADTIKGRYIYTYKIHTTKKKSGNTTIIVKSHELKNVDFEKDYSRLDKILKKYLGLNKITEDDRNMVLEVARTAATGDDDLAYLTGSGKIIDDTIGGINIASLPQEWKEAFVDAGKKYHVNYRILMAIAFVESSFTPNAVGPPNPSGELARGMMQFLPSTWKTFGVDGDGDGKADIFNPIDAIFSAAKYLHYLKIDKDPERALYQYSGGSHAYARKVMNLSQTMTATGGSGQFAWPVPTSHRITSPFTTRVDPVYGGMEKHNGIDIGAPCGTPIVAADNGKVLYSGAASGFGQWIVLNHGGGLTTIYGHMYPQDRLVQVGDQVTRGQIIAYVGANGKATGCHLHFQVEVNGTPVNPLSYLNMSF